MELSIYTDGATAWCMVYALRKILADAGRLNGLERKIILDGNCGLGKITETLRQQFPESMIIGVDCDRKVIRYRKGSVGANLNHLPFVDNSIALVFTAWLYDYTRPNNPEDFHVSSVPYTTDLPSAVREINRVLEPNGMYVPFRDHPIRTYLEHEARKRQQWRMKGEYIFEKI